MGRQRVPSTSDTQRRTKARHDPNPPREISEEEEEDVEMSEEDESPQEEQFVMEPRRKGKEPMETSSCRSSHGHEAPYIMQSMPVQPKIIKRDWGLAHEVCPNHPEHLEITFHWDQRIESICPKLHPTQVPHGFTPRLAKNYYNKFVAVKKEQTYDPFMYKKMIGIDARFWNDFHMVL